MKAIEFFNISKEFPGVVALENISFDVLKGSIHGFLGPNGAGKTTTLKLITGLLKPSNGEIKIFGDHPEKAQRAIGFLPETPPFMII
jgi:ABC-2 type transport system ATP-binding protein